jgi:hypothetical protein
MVGMETQADHSGLWVQSLTIASCRIGRTVGLIGHGTFDFVHHFFIDNPGVPRWWPGFCLAFDALFGVLMAWRLLRGPRLSEVKS